MQGGVLFRNWATTILRAGALATVLSFLVLGLAALAVDQAFLAPINASSHVFFGLEAAHAGGFDFLYTGVGGAIHIVACFFWAIVALFLAIMLGARRTLLIWLCGISTALIAAVFDYAFGGGLELALACTFRIASENAVFGLPEIKLGLIPGYGGTQRLPRLVGVGRALEIIMTSRNVKADEAERIGLVNALASGDLLEEGLAFARRFSRYSLPVLDLARRAVQRASDLPLHEGLQVEAELSTLAYRTRDAEEGMAAFEEKRKPEFTDG